MQVEILTNQRTRSLLLIPGNAEEWELLTSLKHIHPMMPEVGSALFLTDAPFTGPAVDSLREEACGTAPSTKKPFLVPPERLTINEVQLEGEAS